MKIQNSWSKQFVFLGVAEGQAVVDTAAQQGLEGRPDLEHDDQLLKQRFSTNVQFTSEGGCLVSKVTGQPKKRTVAFTSMAFGATHGFLGAGGKSRHQNNCAK